MNLGSIEFFVLFLPLGWLAYLLVPRTPRFQNAVLVVLSTIFYLSWTPSMAWIMALSISVNFVAALAMERLRTSPGKHRAVFWAAIVYNTGQLVFLKYAGFFAASLMELMGSDSTATRSSLHFILPIGISFWTLQLIAYQIDVARGRTAACRDFLVFSVFVLFFPQIPSGPIPRPHQLLPQLSKSRHVEPSWISKGAAALLMGYCLKFLVADGIASVVVQPAWADPAHHSALSAWVGLVGYAIQIFGDFAGYSLMAIGCGRFFGIELPQNFTVPFFSTTMADFWRRWHITLNSWLFDYLYGPLLTTRGFFRGRFDLGFVVVFGLSGLWHGASWPFVIWGFVHGLALAIHRRWDERLRRLCRTNRVWVTRRKSFAWKCAAWMLTQSFFVVSLVPFRAQNLDELRTFAAALLGFSQHGSAIYPSGLEWAMVIAALGVFATYNIGGTATGIRIWKTFLRLPAPVRGIGYGLVVVMLLILVPVGTGNFIYAQF
ncbi:MAG: MBOAT family protein [Myxococcales bacterium]|nr:MBOAT family protein [Myxococcales bacterium]